MATWLQLRSELLGTGCPVLEESRAAYEVFDKITSVPRVVVAIGNYEKRQFIQDACGALPPHPAHGVALRQLPSTIVVDCDLHNQSELLPIDAERVLGGSLRLHALGHFAQGVHPSTVAGLAQDIYWHCLAPFSCVFVLFARDFLDFDPIVSFLSTWIRSSSLNPLEVPPRVLIVCDDMKTLQRELDGRLKSNLRATLRTSHLSSANSLCHKAFESIQLLPLLRMETLRRHTDDLFTLREHRRMNFSAIHLQNLLGQAVVNFSRRPGHAFNIYRASRARNPVPRDLADHIVNCF